MLGTMFIDKDIFAHVITRHDNGVPEIKLYGSEDAKRTIYHSLIEQKFYKRI